jgi:hypothetical protein
VAAGEPHPQPHYQTAIKHYREVAYVEVWHYVCVCVCLCTHIVYVFIHVYIHKHAYIYMCVYI